jgi:hypothetical protein
VAEAAPSGIQLSEHNGPDSAIARAPTDVTAFVGRSLKGPVGVPVPVSSFAEYHKIFGGLWQPAPMSYAIEQFFDNGGRAAIIVRVVNGGRPPSLSLPSEGGGVLTLVGLSPGSREYLRASVDYDGIGSGEADRFNLVVQRMGGPGAGLSGTGLIEEQEIFRRVSVNTDDARFVADALLESRLVRMAGQPPARRPALPPPASPGLAIGYVATNNDGDDGAALTDYDVIGSAQACTGLFALSAMPFNLLCVPPLARDQDVGASTLLVAARFCRERQATLVVDPPREWLSATQALEGMREWPFRSDAALMYFPRLVAFDRLRGKDESFACSGAVAGMLARFDECSSPWLASLPDQPQLRPRLRPACEVDDADRQRLLQAGINVLRTARGAASEVAEARTLASGNSLATDWRYLAPRRLAQFIVQSVEQGTRWTVFAQNGSNTWRRVRGQVEAFLESLDQEGAFPGDVGQERYFVVCDERLNGPGAEAEARLSLLVGFAASRPGEFHAFVVTQRASGSAVRSVSVNRMATSGARVSEEIETAILRGLTAP